MARMANTAGNHAVPQAAPGIDEDAALDAFSDPAWVAAAFEKARGLEQIRLGTDVRTWEEDESPFELVAGLLREKGAAAL